MTVRVRSMRNDDIDSVYAIELASHRAPWGRDILRDCVFVGYDCRILELVHASEAILIGFIICRSLNTTCHILNLCIAPASQGKGYGQFLLENFLDSQTTTSTDTVVLEVRPSNVPALTLYEKLGFLQIGIKKGYYGQGLDIEDAIILQKILPKP